MNGRCCLVGEKFAFARANFSSRALEVSPETQGNQDVPYELCNIGYCNIDSVCCCWWSKGIDATPRDPPVEWSVCGVRWEEPSRKV